MPAGCYSLASGPSSGTRRGRTRLLSIGPVTSQAPPTRPPQPPAHHMRRAAVEVCQFSHGEGSLAGTDGRQAVDREGEAGQLMERTG